MSDGKAGAQGAHLTLWGTVAGLVGTAVALAQSLQDIRVEVVAVLGALGVAAAAWGLSWAFVRRRSGPAVLFVVLLVAAAGVAGAAVYDRFGRGDDPSVVGSAPTAAPDGSSTTSDSGTSPPPVVVNWKYRWRGSLPLAFPRHIDFDADPPPGRQFVDVDLYTPRSGDFLKTDKAGKLVEWSGAGRPTPQQCFELTARSPAGRESHFVNDPQVGRWLCLLTHNSDLPGRMVVLRVTEVIVNGYRLEGTVYDR